jgi:two-component system, NtrC family, sensor kinase
VVNATVLVVDDSLTVRMDLAEALEAAGFRPIACATAAEARAALVKEEPALVILDVRLPDGDGVELLGEIRASGGAYLPVMLLSTEAEVSDRIRGMQTGADEYVHKPYDARYVVSRARALVTCTPEPSGEAGQRVLIIDDSRTYAEVVGAALEAEGYDITTAGTGEDGLRLAADLRPSAMVIDNLLPGIDGATVVRRIRTDAALRCTPCLLLTASDEEGAELMALEAGADAFVRKTEDVPLLVARFKAMLRGAGAPHTTETTASLSGPKRILAVDDSETYLQGLSEVLCAEGHDVVLARSGEEALDLLRVQKVDCILLDIRMPGLDGKETCRRIKAEPEMRDTPLILLTALEDRQSMLEGFSMGADDYVSKSGHFAVLKARVRAQIRRKQTEDENRRVREEVQRMELETGETRAAKLLARERAAHAEDLERKNKELEAFSYSVSHDLRAPLRAIDGFSRSVLRDFSDTLHPRAIEDLQRVRSAAKRMSDLIDDLLSLAKISQSDLVRGRVDLSALARSIGADLKSKHPEREVEFAIEGGLEVEGDGSLVRILLENLLGNAWKFTSKRPGARIELARVQLGSEPTFLVRDNGAGFDTAYADRLFSPFQRLHSPDEFEGTGIGLATVHRIVTRHGGRIWAEARVELGATFFFTLEAKR